MSAPPRPPRLAAALLARITPPHWYESLAGDLLEEFAARSRASSLRAVWWYRWQVFGILLAAVARMRPRRVISPGGFMTRMVTDVVSAWRALCRRPRFALILVILLGGSLGTSAAVLAIAESYLWRPLPYPAADRLVAFSRTSTTVRPPEDLSALRRGALLGEVADLAPALDVDGFTIADGTTPTTVLGLWATADLFEALDVRPIIGRTFTAEDVAAQRPVVLISHAVWTERYGADPSVLGRRITLRGVERTDVTTPFTVIGVLPPRFWHLDERIAVVAPLKEGTGDVVFFRLKEGIAIERAETRLTALVTAMNLTVDPAWRARLVRLQDDHVEPIRELLSAVSLAVVMLVLIACANVAMLQATRALGREQEMGIRSALGAGRGRLIGQLLAENVILAAASFGLSILVARALVKTLVPAVELYVGRTLPGGLTAAAPSVRVLAVMAAVSLLGTVVLGVLAGVSVRPASETLRAHGGGTETKRRARLRQALAVLQVAATLALLVGASLALRTAWHLSRVDLGFDPHGVVTGSLVLSAPRYPDDGPRRIVAAQLLDALEQAPEIDAAGLITVPAFGIRFPRPVFRSGTSEAGAPTAVLMGANDGYFDAVRLRVVEGRALSASEARGFEPVAVISASLAARLFPSSGAIGEMITTTALRPMQGGVEVGPAVLTTYRVVGVVADVRRSLRRDAVAEMYVPLAQASLRDLTLQIRGRDGVPASDVAAAVARTLAGVDRDVPLNASEPFAALLARQVVRPRFVATLLGIFAGLAAVGALAGLYAVSAWVAGLRRREAAIRVALGATRAQVIRAMMTGTALSVAAGLAIGWWGSLVLGRLMTRELSGVRDDDLTTRVVAAAALCVCATVAVYRPVQAITRHSPSEALRE